MRVLIVTGLFAVLLTCCCEGDNFSACLGWSSKSSQLGIRGPVDSDSLLCDLLQVTSPLWASLFLIYKVKVLGQIGDPFSFHYFLGLYILENFFLSSELHLRDVKS